jgi:hypothetical protein
VLSLLAFLQTNPTAVAIADWALPVLLASVLAALGGLLKVAMNQRDRVRDISGFLFGPDGQDGFAKRVDRALATVERIPPELESVCERVEGIEMRWAQSERDREARFEKQAEELRRLFREANLREHRR